MVRSGGCLRRERYHQCRDLDIDIYIYTSLYNTSVSTHPSPLRRILGKESWEYYSIMIQDKFLSISHAEVCSVLCGRAIDRAQQGQMAYHRSKSRGCKGDSCSWEGWTDGRRKQEKQRLWIMGKVSLQEFSQSQHTDTYRQRFRQRDSVQVF